MDQFEFHFREVSSKFDYAFTTLNFATLALSIQFSPGLGNILPELLIVSWALFLLAGLAGGYRLMRETVFLRLNLKRNQARDVYREVSDLGDSPANFFDPDTGEPVTPEEVMRRVAVHRANVEKADKMLNDMLPEFPRWFKVQVISFLLGITVSGFFTSINYWYRSHHP